MKPVVKQLRAEMTPAEAVLWERLRAGRLEVRRIRRQHPIGRYIADFCCPASKLIVEVDGPIHQGREAEDAARQAYLEQRGYTVLRVTNEDVFERLDLVLERIRDALI
jgi:very-short-patch-repair endonuclease